MKTEIVVVTAILSLYLFHCRGNRHVCILNAGALVTKKLAVLFDFGCFVHFDMYIYIYIHTCSNLQYILRTEMYPFVGSYFWLWKWGE